MNEVIWCFAAPEGPPQDLVIRQLNSSSSLVKWSEPASAQQNGVITGYQVRHRHTHTHTRIKSLKFIHF